MGHKISVIVPVYNVENYLSQCLESILNQTLTDIEIICINDGSTDSSAEILKEFQKEDERVFVLNKTNSGYGSSCNAGLRLSRGEYISIIESDDYIDKNMLDDLYNLAKEHNADVVKSSYYEYEDINNTVSKINWSEEYNMPKDAFKIADCTQLVYFHPSIWSCIYKKSFLDKNSIRFVEAKGAGWADNPFQMQTLCLAQKILYTDNAYYYYRLTNPSSSSNIVNIKNPFDRSDEVHEFLMKHKIRDKNLFAHLYKREISYIHTVLAGVSAELFDFACKKIDDMIRRMDRKILFSNKYVNDYEKSFYEDCKSKEGIKTLMKRIQKEDENPIIVNIGA